MSRNYYGSEYSVPTLSLSSSRSKKAVPTKDTTEVARMNEIRSRNEIIDRINRPPIFSSKNIKQSKASIENSSHLTNQINNSDKYASSLNRNVYLRQEEQINEQVTFRPEKIEPQQINRSSHIRGSNSLLLRNPESNRAVQIQIEKKLQDKKLDVNKTMFDRKIKKLLEEAENYQKQLVEIYKEDNQDLNSQLDLLQKCRKQATTLNFSINV